MNASRGAYYNEFDPYAAQWLRNLIAKGLIPAGDVDERSIVDVAPDDLAGYRQCHFFAGIGGWALACRLAGWPDDREIWTGSPPCQPFSVAGKGKAQADDRHLWPHLFRLVRARRPACFMGEQVAAAVGKDWLDGVLSDLEGIGYAGRAVVVPACAVDAPHRRDRLWFVADRGGAVGHGICARLEGLAGNDNDPRGWAQPDRPASAAGGGGDVADADNAGCGPRGGHDTPDGHRHSAATASHAGAHRASAGGSAWHGAGWIIGHDGKARRVGSDVRRVVDGLSGSLDGVCASFYAEAAEGVTGYAKAAKCGPDEVLRAVRNLVASEAVWQEPRGFFGVSEAEILLPYLCELERRIDQVGLSGAVQEDEGHGLRGLRIPARPTCAPQGRGLHEQCAGQYTDSLRALSRLLARAARQAADPLLRDAPPMGLLANGVEARVGKLRALGNAIVPQVAAEVIGAYLDCAP